MNLPQLTPDDLEITATDDSSFTLFHKGLGVHYRSTHGANTESKAVFIQGSKITEQKEWKVVELGFGGTVNFQNLMELRKNQPIHYIAIDHQPIPPQMIEGDSLAIKMAKAALDKARKNNEVVTITEDNVCLELHPFEFSSLSIQDNWAMAFFHDPFGPKINPDCWTKECFQFAHRCLDQNGILATYGAAGHARRAMASAGFHIAMTKGPGKKREITFASKNSNSLQHAKLLEKYRKGLS